MAIEAELVTSSPRKRSPARLALGVLLAGLVCAAYGAATNRFDAWWIGDDSARAPVEDLLRGALVVIIPAGIAGMIWMREVGSFHTRRGAFWTTIGALGFIGAFTAFPQAMRVDSAVGLLGWLGGWLAPILLIGVPVGWWLGRQ